MKITKKGFYQKLAMLNISMLKGAILLLSINIGLYTVSYNVNQLVDETITIKPINAQIVNIVAERVIKEPTVEEVKDEIKRQSELFGNDTDFMLELADCESGFYYKAKNKVSTARGVYQYVILTWESTESAKEGKERNDYKANIREAMIDIANGEYFHWRECLDKMGY